MGHTDCLTRWTGFDNEHVEAEKQFGCGLYGQVKLQEMCNKPYIYCVAGTTVSKERFSNRST